MVRNLTWLSLSYALAKPLWFAFLTAGCMRLLSPEGYGVFTTSLALAMVTSVASDFGTAEHTTREVARRPALASRLFTNVLLGRIGLALASLGVALGIGAALGYSVEHLYAVVAAGLYVGLFRGAEYCRAVFRAFERLDHEAVFTTFEKVLVVAGGFGMLLVFRTPAMAFVGMTLGMAVAFSMTVWWIDRRFAPLRLRLWRPSYLATVLRHAAPLGLIAVFSAIPGQVGQILVGAVLGTEAAGLYGAAHRTVEAMMLLTSIVVAAVFARLSSLFHQDHRQAHARLLRRVLAGMTGVSLVVAGIVSVMASHVIAVLAGGGHYEEAGRVLAALAWTFPLMNGTSISLIALISIDAHRFAAWSMGAAAVSSAVLIFILLPPLGVFAPVWGLGVTYLALAVANLWKYQRIITSTPSPAGP